MKLLKELNYIFPRSQKWKFVGLFFLILISTCFDFLSVSMILPFVAIIVSPEALASKSWYQLVCRISGSNSPEELIVFLSIFLMCAYTVKNVYRIWLGQLETMFLARNQINMSAKMIDCYMRKPYTFHLQHNTAEIVRSVTNDVGTAFSMVLSLISLVTNLLITTALIVFLFAVDPVLTLTVVFAIGVCSLLYFLLVKRKLREYGERNRKIYTDMVKAVHQAVGGIKEVKIMGREAYFVDAYAKNGDALLRDRRRYSILGSVPSKLVETLCVAGVLAVVAVEVSAGADMSAIVPTLSAFAVAVIRLLPCANSINGILGSISYQRPCLDSVYEDLKDYEQTERERKEEIARKRKMPRKFENSNGNILLENVSYTYPNTEAPVLHDVNLTIQKGTSVGIVGVTGAGKTTLIDVMLGLLKPQTGAVYYGEEDIQEDYAEWQRRIGYIPQFIYLADETIRRNVALGVYDDQIDEEKVWQSLEGAQLADFVRSLPEGLDTVIGERGVRLSGGQRQRIGIARALYSDPEILFFDEATSSLDNETEKAVMKSIHLLSGEKTVIIIAHRLTTLDSCSKIYRVENGCVKETVIA